MKKSKNKLSLSLVTTFIASLAMTSCDVTPSKNTVVTFTGYDGNQVEVLTDDVYYDYLKTSSGIGKIYDAMLETLIRYEFQYENSALKEVSEAEGIQTEQTYAQIEKAMKQKIEGLKRETKDKGGDYDAEWKSLLESYGIDTESGNTEKKLLQKLIYDEEKKEIEDWYFDVNKVSLLEEYIGLSTDTTNSKFPYHIRHILASVSGGSNDFYNGTITEENAKRLNTIVTGLYDGKLTFGELADELSGDTGSGEEWGSLEIMDKSTSFVDEFKLGIYAYDILYSGRTDTEENPIPVAVKNGLGLNLAYDDVNTPENNTVTKKLQAIGLGKVPFDAFNKIYEYRDKTTDDEGATVNEGKEQYYPRNIYWNKYLNRHNVFVITNSALPQDSYNGTVDPNENITVNTPLAGKPGFRYVAGISENENQLVLTADETHPIVCVRSQHGIHFMIIQKSVLDSGLTTYYNPDAKLPGDTDYDPSVETYVTYINGNKADYKDRADKLKSTIKSFDSTYSYRLFEYLVAEEGSNISFNVLGENQVDLYQLVKDYIASIREYDVWNAAESLNSSWRNYLELISIQEANRTEARLIPELCALKFKDYSSQTGEGGVYAKGGACYYAK